MTLNELIETHAAESAAASDWDSVAATLNAATVQRTSAGTLTSMAQTLAVLDQAEIEPTLQAFDAYALGRSGLQKLATTGLDFAHPLTIGLIEAMRAGLPVGVADKLRRIGAWRVSPAAAAGLGVVTADQCRNAVTEEVTAAVSRRMQAAIAQATAAVQQQANEESDVSLSELIATFSATLTQHWSV